MKSIPTTPVRGRWFAVIVALLGVWLAAAPLAGQANAPGTAPATMPVAAPATQPAKVPAGVDLGSPRATMFSFLRAMNDVATGVPGAYDRAVACMDTSRVEARNSKEVARQLYEILNKIGTVAERELPDAPAAEESELDQFTYFPRWDVHGWIHTALEGKELKGKIVLERLSTGPWLFTADTVAAVPVMHEQMLNLPDRHNVGARRIMGILGPTFARTATVSWLLLLGSILLGLVVGKFFQVALRAVAERLEKRDRRGQATALRNAAGPAGLGLLTAGVASGLQFIHLEPATASFFGGVFQFLYILSLGWFLYNLVDLVEMALRQITDRTANKLDDMVVPLIRKALRIFLVIIFSLVVAQNVLGLDITGWLAGLGIVGLAVSLASQDSIRNLFGSVTVFFDGPFTVGDTIRFAGVEGVVEEIGFRSSRIRTPEGHLVAIPNMKFIDSNVENLSARTYIHRAFAVPLPAGVTLEKIEGALSAIRDVLAEPGVVAAFDLKAFPPRVAIDDYPAPAPSIKVIYRYTLKDGRNPWSHLDFAQTLNIKILRAVTAALG